jgi:hypothetical protein
MNEYPFKEEDVVLAIHRYGGTTENEFVRHS